MTISSHFHHINSGLEQTLVHNLTKEAIFLRGLDFWYLPRNSSDADWLFGEDNKSTFEAAVSIEMYCSSMRGFEGEGDFLGRFGLDIRDEANFTVDKLRFTEEITAAYPTIKRPREGDLIFFELPNSIFEITFVEHETPFYSRGTQSTWEISSKKFVFNRDNMNTGIADVDSLNLVDPFDDNEEIQVASDGFVLHTETDPFSENTY